LGIGSGISSPGFIRGYSDLIPLGFINISILFPGCDSVTFVWPLPELRIRSGYFATGFDPALFVFNPFGIKFCKSLTTPKEVKSE